MRYENSLYSEWQDTPDSNALSYYRLQYSVEKCNKWGSGNDKAFLAQPELSEIDHFYSGKPVIILDFLYAFTYFI